MIPSSFCLFFKNTNLASNTANNLKKVKELSFDHNGKSTIIFNSHKAILQILEILVKDGNGSQWIINSIGFKFSKLKQVKIFFS